MACCQLLNLNFDTFLTFASLLAFSGLCLDFECLSCTHRGLRLSL